MLVPLSPPTAAIHDSTTVRVCTGARMSLFFATALQAHQQHVDNLLAMVQEGLWQHDFPRVATAASLAHPPQLVRMHQQSAYVHEDNASCMVHIPGLACYVVPHAYCARTLQKRCGVSLAERSTVGYHWHRRNTASGCCATRSKCARSIAPSDRQRHGAPPARGPGRPGVRSTAGPRPLSGEALVAPAAPRAGARQDACFAKGTAFGPCYVSVQPQYLTHRLCSPAGTAHSSDFFWFQYGIMWCSLVVSTVLAGAKCMLKRSVDLE